MRNQLCLFTLVVFISISSSATSFFGVNPLKGKIICLDAGHGGTAQTDNYRVGPSGEREEWVNLRVVLVLKEMLEEKGAKVILTREKDTNVALLKRAKIAKDNSADLFLSVHHNATADPEVNFPIIYFHGNASENQASVNLGKEIARGIKRYLYRDFTPVSLVSDHTIFSEGGAAVLRGTYGIPSVIAEASFFTNPAEENRLKQSEHNYKEALGFLTALESFFGKPASPILEKNSKIILLPSFKTFQEAERMSEEALLWYEDFLKGKALMKRNDRETWEEAYEFFTRSARSFPDSYVAEKCHLMRAVLLRKLDKRKEAKQTTIRANEFYVSVEE